MQHKEFDEQVRFFQMLELYAAKKPVLNMMFAVPLGELRSFKVNAYGQRYSPSGKRLKKMGVKAGIPDVLFPVPNTLYSGMAIEFKTTKGRLTQSQQYWIDQLEHYKWYCLVATDAQIALSETLEYLNTMG